MRFAGSDYALFFPRTPAAEVPLRYWSSEEEACQLDKFWQIKSVLRVSLGTYGYMLILQCADWVKVSALTPLQYSNQPINKTVLHHRSA